MHTLKQKGLIDFKWVRYEQGNLVERIWLNTSDEKIAVCYKMLGRRPKRDIIDSLNELLRRYADLIKNRDEIYVFLLEQAAYLENKLKISRFFIDDLTLDEQMLRGLIALADNQNEIQERVFSTKIYGDSKYFEKLMKGKLLAILRYVKQDTEGEVSDEELLREKGVVKWPEIMEFTGAIGVILPDGTVLDYEAHFYGAYINSLTVEHIERVDLREINTVLFIENKANYTWYVSHEKKESELVLFHGGCYSPIKGKWFRQIYEAAGRSPENTVQFFHWSDIDIGGFRIFSRLKEQIIPSLQPFKMDRITLDDNKEKGLLLEKSSYKKQLERMKEDIRYIEFWSVIEEMLRLNIRLEQENLLLDTPNDN